MLIHKLSLKDFMPYRGHQEIVLPSGGQRRVSVVFGENMRGKTSLLNAIRWTLYGKALARHGREVPRKDIVNWDAAADGNFRCETLLLFSDGRQEYEMRRAIYPRSLVTRPKRDADFDEEVTLRVDGQVIPGADVERTVDRLLPEAISRFFLFDGESLQEYEMLIMDDSGQGDLIKERIEEVLGVPALLHARTHLWALLADARREQTRAMKRQDSVRAQANHMEEIQRQIEAVKGDLEQQLKLHGQCKGEIEDLDSYLRGIEAQRRLAERRERLEGDIRSLEASRTAAEEERRLELRDGWIDLVWDQIAAKRRTLEEQESRRLRLHKEAIRLEQEVSNWNSLLAGKPCPTCGQPTVATPVDDIRVKQESAKARLKDLQSEFEAPGSTDDDLRVLRQIGGGRSAAVVRRIESRIRRASVDIAAATQEIVGINQQLRSFDTAQMARKREELDAKNRQLGRLEPTIKKTRSQLADLERQYGTISKMLSSSPAAKNEKSNRRVQVLEDLYQIFDGSIGELREDLKVRVEEAASQAFRALTTDPTYSGLKIGERYGLDILDQKGRVVSERSAGAEQIVALSLISGLNQTAEREAPIIMDTPFGRLDPRHRKKVLQFLPTMSEQVVLLVHEGELRRTEELRVINDRIGKVYEIEYVTSSESRLSEVRG